jgi:hypothetical protein
LTCGYPEPQEIANDKGFLSTHYMPTKTTKKATSTKVMSIRAFAKSIVVSEGAVRKAIREGKLVEGYDPVAKKINQKVAGKSTWVQQQIIIKPKAGVSKERARKKMESVQKPVKPSKRVADEPAEHDDMKVDEMDVEYLLKSIRIKKGMQVSDVIKYRELIALTLDKKKLQEQHGLLVPRDKVDKALQVIGSELKKALQQLPQRIVMQVRDAENEVQGITVMLAGINEVLTGFATITLKT